MPTKSAIHEKQSFSIHGVADSCRNGTIHARKANHSFNILRARLCMRVRGRAREYGKPRKIVYCKRGGEGNFRIKKEENEETQKKVKKNKKS